MSNTNFDKLMNLLVVTVVKKRFLLPNKMYHVYILYTPYRSKIYKITSTYEKFPYIIGDDIKNVIRWCYDNGHEYRKRKGKKNIWDS